MLRRLLGKADLKTTKCSVRKICHKDVILPSTTVHRHVWSDGVLYCAPSTTEQGYTQYDQVTTAIDEDDSDYIQDGLVRPTDS